MKMPTDYQLAAALRVSRLLDETDNPIVDLRSAYLSAVTQGEHADGSLLVGEEILASVDLLQTVGGSVVGGPALHALAKLDDETAIGVLRSMFQQGSFDPEDLRSAEMREAVGLAGELAVAEACRGELIGLGHPELAVGVQQVSVISDALGYDVLAPRIDAAPRKLEVKTTASLVDKGLMRFFLTRNEYEQGRRAPESWSLVACHFVDMQVIILGWTPARTLMPYLPDDGNGRWAEALVRFPLSGLAVGIPSAI